MDNKNIIIERAKDGNWTCKVQINDIWKYIYSKYTPIRKIKKIDNNSNYIILGIGLGYEVNEILNNTNGQIYIIDENKNFYQISNKLKIISNIIHNDRVKFIFGNNYKNIKLNDIHNWKVYSNENITQLNSKFFYKVIKYLKSKEQLKKKEKVAFYGHITIADDAIKALNNIGYNVVKMSFSTKDIMIKDIMKEIPDYIFSINLSEKIAYISEILNIPYISWTVDSPTYPLYSDLIESENVIAFLYDKANVEEFNKKNFKNIFYMPVAVNVNRLDKIEVNLSDKNKYSCDVSFLGTSGMDNEFNKYMFGILRESTTNDINKIFSKQNLNKSKFILNDIIDDSLINRIEEETGYILKTEKFMDKRTKLSFLLGKKFNEIDRIRLIKELSQIFNVYVYGDESWKNINCNYIKYKGYADHFYEMPKIFRCSKININYTRVYVESGLPMRIFDVLGSKGFLVSNYKEEIPMYFSDGQDLVIYRDTKDLIEIINYYLNNDKERKNIILNGYEKVKKYHNFENRLEKIMKISKNYLYMMKYKKSN